MTTKWMAEQSTGCREHPDGLGSFVDDTGRELDDEQAANAFAEGEELSAPSAGAGSFEAAFERLGCSEVKVLNWASASGDWAFLVYNGESWSLAYQVNRTPYLGFAYHQGPERFSSFDEAAEFAAGF